MRKESAMEAEEIIARIPTKVKSDLPYYHFLRVRKHFVGNFAPRRKSGRA